jgi:hypothetical protein
MMLTSTSSCGDSGDSKDWAETMREMHGPQGVDQAVRQAVSICWTMLPKEKRSVENVEKEIRRLVERVLRDFKEDNEAFGVSDDA